MKEKFIKAIISDINSKIPVEIQTYKSENGVNNILGILYTPHIFYKYLDKEWTCKYSNIIEGKTLFKVKGESIEEIIGKVCEYIESKEYGEIYDLTYNFKEYETNRKT